MNPSILLSPYPSSPNPTLFTPFLTPSTTLRLSSTYLRRHRYKISTVSCFIEQPSTSTATVDLADVFGDKRELKSIQSFVDAVSPPVRIAGSALILAAAVAAGYGLGSRFGGPRNASLAGAAVAGAAGGVAAYALNSCVPEVATANLHNYVVGCDHPGAVKKRDIDAIANKYICIE